MDIISQVTSAMQTVLTKVADAAAITSGFLKKKRKLTGSVFVQTLVFGWLANPDSTYDELDQRAHHFQGFASLAQLPHLDK